jgi:hypothetical protein
MATEFYTNFSTNFSPILTCAISTVNNETTHRTDIEFQRDQEVAQLPVAVSSFECVIWAMKGCRAILPVRC